MKIQLIALIAAFCMKQAHAAAKILITNTSNDSVALQMHFKEDWANKHMPGRPGNPYTLTPGQKKDYELSLKKFGKTNKRTSNATLLSVKVNTVADTKNISNLQVIKSGPTKNIDQSKEVKAIDVTPDNIKIAYTDGSIDQN